MPIKNLIPGKKLTKIVSVPGDGFVHDLDVGLNVDEEVAIKVFSKYALKISIRRALGPDGLPYWDDFDLAAKQAMKIGVANADFVNFANPGHAAVPRVVVRVKSIGLAVTNSQFAAMDLRMDAAENTLADKFHYFDEITIVAAP